MTPLPEQLPKDRETDPFWVVATNWTVDPISVQRCIPEGCGEKLWINLANLYSDDFIIGCRDCCRYHTATADILYKRILEAVRNQGARDGEKMMFRVTGYVEKGSSELCIRILESEGPFR